MAFNTKVRRLISESFSHRKIALDKHDQSNNKDKKEVEKETPIMRPENAYPLLMERYIGNLIDYSKIPIEKTMISSNQVDVSIIIPVMGRENFAVPLIEHLNKAINKCPHKKFSITFVEHSNKSLYSDNCKNKANLIWIRKENDEPFNKCLAMNIGALFSNSSRYYLFHDLDLLMKENFFIDIFKNLHRVHNDSALQSFAGRRVVVMDSDKTSQILARRLGLNAVIPDSAGAHYCKEGAPGGSIFIKADDFYKVGGFDAEFFHSYSCEDSFFYKKLEHLIGITGCDDPQIDLFHMDHPRTNGAGNSEMRIHLRLLDCFTSLSSDERTKFIEYIENNFKKNRL